MVKKKALGEMLVNASLLTENQLADALGKHKALNLKLGEYLVREGLITEPQVVKMLSKQLKLKQYMPEEYPLDVDLADLLPAEIARKHQAVPVRQSGYLLSVAMVNPMDINSLDVIELNTNTEVEALICTEQELNFLMMSLYGSDDGIGSALEDVEGMQYGTEEEITVSEVDDIEVSSLQDMAEDAPVVRLVNSILYQAVREGASDIHISPEKNYVQIRFRVDGKLREVPAPSKSMILPIISRLKILANMDIAVSRKPQDGRFTVKMNQKEINIRASIIPTIYGENMVLRLLDTAGAVYSLSSLGLNEFDRIKIEEMVSKPYGMVLSSGPTGSGKTTSLYSILKKINKPDINIITLEDPVEYRLEKIRQTQLNVKAGVDFAEGLRAILRQDPDVIMVGEIRDAKTASISVQAALTGHRLFSTMHTNDAAGVISRFVDMGIKPFLISSVLLVSIAQRLIRTLCPYCKKPKTPSDETLKFWGLYGKKGGNYMEAKGCVNCMNKGYRGRTGIFEVLVVDDMIRSMIIENRTSREITLAAQRAGTMRTLKENAAEKAFSGETTLEEAATAILV